MRLEADRASFAYGRGTPCLRRVSLAVSSGEVAFLLGPNGSGKTTLLGCLAGTRRPSTGTVLLDGRPLLDLVPRERAKRIGVVPQFYEPAWGFSVEETVALGRAPYVGLFSRPGREDRLAVERALDAVGLTRLRRRPTTRLSGGERQLVWIARGLAQGANCLLLDEPTAHLDPQHEQALFAVVCRLAASGAGFVIASHHPGSALLYGHHVALLRDGETACAGPPAETMTEDALRSVYGVDFAIVTDGEGCRAIVPRVAVRVTASPTSGTRRELPM
jgi:iron complex transport system ATP-binding protein